MPRYSQGAIVIQQESPWSQFLEGIGKGVSMGIKRRQQKADAAEQNVDELILKITSGQIPQEVLASQPFEDYAAKYGIIDHPEVQSLISKARESLPTDLTETPPPAGQGVTQIPSATMPQVPAAVATPRAQITPTAKQVWDHLDQIKNKRALATEDLKGRQGQLRQIELKYIDEDIRRNRAPSIAEQIKRARDAASIAGIPWQDISISVGSDNRVTTNIRTPDPDKLISRADKQNAKELAFYKVAATYEMNRASQVGRLQDLLSKDKVTMEDLAFGDEEDAEMRKVMLEAASFINSAKPSKKSVTEIVNRVEVAIGVYNKVVDKYNNVIEKAGVSAGIDEEYYGSKFVKRLSFEDVSGGMTPKQYRDAKNPPSGDKLISELRKDYQPTGIQSGLPGSRSSSSDSDKVTRAYEGVAGVVKDALAGNKGLTKDSIRSNIMEMKNEIMAEYGLNERGFSLLLSMADRVMA